MTDRSTSNPADYLAVAVNLVSAWTHLRLVHALQHGDTTMAGRPSTLAITVAVILALLGLAMAIYLVLVRDPHAHGAPVKEQSMTLSSESGFVTIHSRQTVDRTVQKLEEILQAKGVKLFALVDHSGEAAKAGLALRPTKLLIFGNPKAGTPLMAASPSIAIDLPLKILVWEDAGGQVCVSYNSPAYLQARHGLPPELGSNLAVVEALANSAASDEMGKKGDPS